MNKARDLLRRNQHRRSCDAAPARWSCPASPAGENDASDRRKPADCWVTRTSLIMHSDCRSTGYPGIWLMVGVKAGLAIDRAIVCASGVGLRRGKFPDHWETELWVAGRCKARFAATIYTLELLRTKNATLNSVQFRWVPIIAKIETAKVTVVAKAQKRRFPHADPAFAAAPARCRSRS